MLSEVSISGVQSFAPLFLSTFWVLPLTYFDLPQSARAHIFPQSVKRNYFAAAPLVLTPFVRNQVRPTTREHIVPQARGLPLFLLYEEFTRLAETRLAQTILSYIKLA